MKTRSLEAEFFHVDERTDRQVDRERERETDRHDQANSRFLQLCKRT